MVSFGTCASGFKEAWRRVRKKVFFFHNEIRFFCEIIILFTFQKAKNAVEYTCT